MSEIILKQDIQNRIYRLRGRSIILDSDLAFLYGVQVKALNQAVKRNLRRFPPQYMFQLTTVEFDRIRSQIVTASKRNIRYRPLAFTEHGIAMLSAVLKSDRAIQVSIVIIDAFIKMRHDFFQNKDLAQKFEKLEGRVNVHETDIRLLVQDVQEMKNKPTKPKRRKRMPIQLDIS